MKGRTTQLLLFLVGSGIELLVDVNPNDKVSLVKLNVATQLCHKFGFPGAEAISALATGMAIGRLGYDWRNDNPLWMYGVTDDLYGSVFYVSMYLHNCFGELEFTALLPHCPLGQQTRWGTYVNVAAYLVAHHARYHEYLLRHLALCKFVRTQATVFFVGTFHLAEKLGIATTDVLDIIVGHVEAYERYVANRLGYWFRLPWAWPMLCHPVYGLDVAKRLVQLVENGRLGNGSFEYYKIDCAGVLSTPALWAAVVAFARGTAPLADAACNQSLKIYAESFLRGTTPSSVAAAARPPHTSHNTHNQRAPRRRATAGFARDLDAAPAVAATRPSA